MAQRLTYWNAHQNRTWFATKTGAKNQAKSRSAQHKALICVVRRRKQVEGSDAEFFKTYGVIPNGRAADGLYGNVQILHTFFNGEEVETSSRSQLQPR